MKLIWRLLLGAMLFAVPARADTVYDLSGTATMIGCGGSCNETIDFSFGITEQLNPYGEGGYALFLAPGASFAVSGPIPFTLRRATGGGLSAGDGLPNDGFDYVPLYYFPPDGAGLGGDPSVGDDELDIAVGCGVNSPICVPTPSGIGALLYSCGDQACMDDFVVPFCPQPEFCSGRYYYGWPDSWTSVTDARVTRQSAVPEPSSLALVIVGIGLLGLACRMRPGRLSVSPRAALCPRLVKLSRESRHVGLTAVIV